MLPRPTRILRNARVVTMDDANPRAEAIAVAGEAILAVGAEKDVRHLASAGAEVVDAGGRTILPGFIDSHSHFADYALSRRQLKLDGMSMEEIRRAVRELSVSIGEGEWMVGRGWSIHDLGKFPSKEDLDAATDKPVVLWSHDYHSAWVNSAALRAADISPSVENPPGGEIIRDERGGLTGVFKENACFLIAGAIPPATDTVLREAVLSALDEAAHLGITSIHDFSALSTLSLYKRLREEEKQTARIWKIVPPRDLEDAAARGMRTGAGDDWIRVGHYKMFADGALGSRTAAMRAPYGGTSECGMLIHDPEALLSLMRRASEAGFALAVHAIGDRANAAVLDAYENIPPLPSANAPRRIEHAQHVSRADAARFARLEVVASIQPLHMEDDIPIVERLLHDRKEDAYPFGSLLRAGARLACGSDAPIASPDVRLGIRAACERRRMNGEPRGGFVPSERLSLMDALRGYTRGAAFAEGAERRKGMLAPGMLADLVVLRDDAMRVPPEEWPAIPVDGTMAGGTFVFKNF